MSDIVFLKGGDYPTGKPNACLVEELERLLERAKSGDIIGMAAAILHEDRAAAFRLAGFVGGYSLVGALRIAERRVLAIVDQGD